MHLLVDSTGLKLCGAGGAGQDPMRVGGGRVIAEVVALSTWSCSMPNIEHLFPSAVRSDPAMPIDMDAMLFVALELSLSSWVVVASVPGEDKASKHGVAACDGPGLLSLLRRLQERAERRSGHPVGVLVMQEAGRDGFWVHRLLEAHAVGSVVVGPSSIAVNRRSRRAKPALGLDPWDGPHRCGGDAAHLDGLGSW